MEQNNIKESDCWLFLVNASVSFEGSWNGTEKAQLQLHAQKSMASFPISTEHVQNIQHNCACNKHVNNCLIKLQIICIDCIIFYHDLISCRCKAA